jgi:hypothetical protein
MKVHQLQESESRKSRDLMDVRNLLNDAQQKLDTAKSEVTSCLQKLDTNSGKQSDQCKNDLKQVMQEVQDCRGNLDNAKKSTFDLARAEQIKVLKAVQSLAGDDIIVKLAGFGIDTTGLLRSSGQPQLGQPQPGQPQGQGQPQPGQSQAGQPQGQPQPGQPQPRQPQPGQPQPGQPQGQPQPGQPQPGQPQQGQPQPGQPQGQPQPGQPQGQPQPGSQPQQGQLTQDQMRQDLGKILEAQAGHGRQLNPQQPAEQKPSLLPGPDQGKASDKPAEGQRMGQDSQKPAEGQIPKPGQEGQKPAEGQIPKPGQEGQNPAEGQIPKPGQEGQKLAEGQIPKPVEVALQSGERKFSDIDRNRFARGGNEGVKIIGGNDNADKEADGAKKPQVSPDDDEYETSHVKKDVSSSGGRQPQNASSPGAPSANRPSIAAQAVAQAAGIGSSDAKPKDGAPPPAGAADQKKNDAPSAAAAAAADKPKEMEMSTKSTKTN